MAEDKQIVTLEDIEKWQQEQMAVQEQGIERKGRFISTNAGTKMFELPDTRTARTLDCIILDWRFTRHAYNNPWSPNGTKGFPVCGAKGDNAGVPHGSLIPDADAPGPDPKKLEAAKKLILQRNGKATEDSLSHLILDQKPDSCANCAFNEWFSDLNPQGKKGKQCREEIIFSLLPPESEDPEEYMFLRVNRQSNRSFSAYFDQVKAKTGKGPNGVKTTLTMNPDTNFVQVTFNNFQLGPDPQVHNKLMVMFQAMQLSQETLNRENRYDNEDDVPF